MGTVATCEESQSEQVLERTRSTAAEEVAPSRCSRNVTDHNLSGSGIADQHSLASKTCLTLCVKLAVTSSGC